jgi:hypothetical protein
LRSRKHTIKLKQAQDKLKLKLPDQLFDFISRLDKPEVSFGKEEWLFWTLNDKLDNEASNFIIEISLDFKKEWGLDGIVFAANGIGDYLVVLPDRFGEQILVMMHESAELKLFGNSIDDLLKNGPEDYFWSDDYIFKLDDDKLVGRNTEENSESPTDQIELRDEDDKLRSYLDDMIDDQRTEKSSELLTGLEKLIGSTNESNKVWALNKLSDIYLKGFGPIPKNMTMALDYNQRAIDLNSHKALSNRAACYFFGFGLDKDIEKAHEFATKANELSKANRFANILATKEGGGMYDKLVDMIEAELKKQRENTC